MQQWNLQAGITIRIGENTNMCLDASNGGQSKGDAIQLWGCNGHANQYWIFKSGSNQIKSALDTSLCIDGGDMKPGTKLMLWDCNGLSQQKWGYDFKQGTIYLAESETDASICVDITGGSLSQGTQMEVWDCNGCWNQDIQLYGPPSTLPRVRRMPACCSQAPMRSAQFSSTYSECLFCGLSFPACGYQLLSAFCALPVKCLPPAEPLSALPVKCPSIRTLTLKLPSGKLLLISIC